MAFVSVSEMRMVETWAGGLGVSGGGERFGWACGRGRLWKGGEKGADRGRKERTEYHFLDDGKYLKVTAIRKTDKTPARRHLVLREVRTFLGSFFFLIFQERYAWYMYLWEGLLGATCLPVCLLVAFY